MKMKVLLDGISYLQTNAYSKTGNIIDPKVGCLTSKPVV